MQDSTTEAETELRKELYELDSALELARQNPDSVFDLAALAAQRQEVQTQLDVLLPKDRWAIPHNRRLLQQKRILLSGLRLLHGRNRN